MRMQAWRGRGWRRTAMVAAGAFALAACATGWRQPTSVRISTDNDAYLFWLPPWERTDHEYTAGARGTAEYAGPSGVLPLARWRRPCREPAACMRHSFSLGQELYTGEPPPTPGVAPAAHPSHRTNAAWLYVEAAERDSIAGDAREVSVRVGVVGPPALGEPMQQFFHVIGPKYPLPVDWNRQLPFEPGFVATVARRRVLVSAGEPGASGTPGGAALTARGSASLGTILTGASGGLTALGVFPLAGASQSGRWPRVSVSADATAYGVLRDEFLDGTFFRSSPRLAKRAIYGEGALSLGLWWSEVRLGYRVARTGARYDLQGAPFNWGTLTAEWRPPR
ncbi:MAG: DUF2219 family protein [Gemmatimonadota bacterium]|nr:DUF2219 family protein [Gemmatimonadota bacterium]